MKRRFLLSFQLEFVLAFGATLAIAQTAQQRVCSARRTAPG
jgi:hypothetical protein